MHFGRLVSLTIATNPAKRFCLLRVIALMLSLPALIRNGAQIENWIVGATVPSSTNAASQEAVVGLAQRVEVACTRAHRDAVVQLYLGYLGL